jgi:hypothetical protein
MMSAEFAICASCLVSLSCAYIPVTESVLEQCDRTSYKLQHSDDIDLFVVEGTFCFDFVILSLWHTYSLD